MSHDFSVLMRKIFIQLVKARELIGKRQGYCKIKGLTYLAPQLQIQQALMTSFRSGDKVRESVSIRIVRLI